MLENIKVSCSQSRDIVPIFDKTLPPGVRDIGSSSAPVEYCVNPRNRTPNKLEVHIEFSYTDHDPLAKRVTELLTELAKLAEQQRGA